jgi:hypothetical protein
MAHILQVTNWPGGALTGQYLQGPRTPEVVRRDGYGFTADPAAAWPFDNPAQATAKAKIVILHMGSNELQFTVIASP